MKIGFFSPMPPARTGVADYSATLIQALRNLAQVEVSSSRADIRLYHLGNNSLHRDIYQRALEEPGVLVLHDAVLNHFFLGFLSEREYIEEFCFNYGPWSEGLAGRLWKNRRRSAADPQYFAFPMLKRIAKTSLGIIVHNPGAVALVRAHAPSARVFEIPHLYKPPVFSQPARIDRLRARLGLRADSFLFGVFGHLRESKRIFAILRATDQVRKQFPSVALLLAGGFASHDLARGLRPLEGRAGVIPVGATPEHEFLGYASIVDACISLRYPAAGETSGITVRLMGLGKPVIMTAGLETLRFPESASIRIDAGPAEQEMLSMAMLWLARRRHDAREIGRNAAAHIAAHHAADIVAQKYMEALAVCYHQNSAVLLA